jgi:hypothetical protein
MGIDKCIEVTFFIVNKIKKALPRTFDDFKLAISLHLSDKVYHFCHDESDVMPFLFELWYS